MTGDDTSLAADPAAPDPAAPDPAAPDQLLREEAETCLRALASPQAGAVTGTALAVDGGMSGLRLRPPAPPA